MSSPVDEVLDGSTAGSLALFSLNPGNLSIVVCILEGIRPGSRSRTEVSSNPSELLDAVKLSDLLRCRFDRIFAAFPDLNRGPLVCILEGIRPTSPSRTEVSSNTKVSLSMLWNCLILFDAGLIESLLPSLWNGGPPVCILEGIRSGLPQ